MKRLALIFGIFLGSLSGCCVKPYQPLYILAEKVKDEGLRIKDENKERSLGLNDEQTE